MYMIILAFNLFIYLFHFYFFGWDLNAEVVAEDSFTANAFFIFSSKF